MNHVAAIVVLLLLSACEVDMKVKVGNPDRSANPDPSWHPYATLKSTNLPELWNTGSITRQDCLKGIDHDLANLPYVAQLYGNPSGCLYVGSDNRLMLYLVNTFYNSNAFLCVAKVRDRAEGSRAYWVFLKGTARNSGSAYCVLG